MTVFLHRKIPESSERTDKEARDTLIDCRRVFDELKISFVFKKKRSGQRVVHTGSNVGFGVNSCVVPIVYLYSIRIDCA